MSEIWSPVRRVMVVSGQAKSHRSVLLRIGRTESRRAPRFNYSHGAQLASNSHLPTGSMAFPSGFTLIDVNGGEVHPLFKYLKKQAPGPLGVKAITWNFTKFLVDGQGKVLERFATGVEPAEIAPAIEALLNTQ